MRKSVLFGDYSWPAKHSVLFADFDYGTPAIGLPNRTKVHLDLLLGPPGLKKSNFSLKGKGRKIKCLNI